jgi:hypothetical protein
LADAEHFITREDMRLWFLLKLRDILPHARTDEDRWEFARYALHVEDIKDWPGPLGRRAGTDPSTQEGLEKAVERVRLAAHIAEEAGEFRMTAKKEEQPVREIDATVDSLVLSNHTEAPAVTFTNIEVNGIPVSFTMRQDVTGAESVRVHYEEFQKLIAMDWVETLDVCDKNGNKIRRIKGEPEPKVEPPTASQPSQPAAPPASGGGAPAGRAPQSGQSEHIATTATVERFGAQQQFRALVFRDANGKKIANLFFPDPSKPRSRLWDMVIDITDADWPAAQDGATKDINLKLFTVPDPKNPQYNKIIAVGRA